MAGYPKVYSIEMDPHEDLQVGALFGWTAGAAREVVEKYLGRSRNIRIRPRRASLNSERRSLMAVNQRASSRDPRRS